MKKLISSIRVILFANGIVSDTAGGMGATRRLSLAMALLQLEKLAGLNVTHYEDKRGKERFKEVLTPDGLERFKELEGKQKAKRLARTAAIEKLFTTLSPTDKKAFPSVADLRKAIERKLDAVNNALDKGGQERLQGANISCMITRTKADGTPSDSFSIHARDKKKSGS